MSRLSSKVIGYTRDSVGVVTDYHVKSIANTVHTKTGTGGNTDQFVCECHIRKLTPRETFRLMDVSDEDIDKIEAADIPQSQQYKMAGNSIVVGVLYHVFKQLFIR